MRKSLNKKKFIFYVLLSFVVLLSLSGSSEADFHFPLTSFFSPFYCSLEVLLKKK